MLTDIYGIQGLSWPTVKNGVVLLPPDVQAAINAVAGKPGVSDDEMTAVLAPYRELILATLGLDDPGPGEHAPTTIKFQHYDKLADILQKYAETARSIPFHDSFVYPSDYNVAMKMLDAVGEDFYLWLQEEFDIGHIITELCGDVGSCTPRLVKMFANAPHDVPFFLYVLYIKDVPVDEAPDVPLSFIEDNPDLLDSDDYNTAVMEAYIRSCLKLFFPEEQVLHMISSMTMDLLRHEFLRAVWRLAGNAFNIYEVPFFDNVWMW